MSLLDQVLGPEQLLLVAQWTSGCGDQGFLRARPAEAGTVLRLSILCQGNTSGVRVRLLGRQHRLAFLQARTTQHVAC